jgi:hypothetical protein
MLAFVEAFWIMGIIFLLMLPLLPLLQYSRPKTKPAEAPAAPTATLLNAGECNELDEEHHLVMH